MFGEKQRMQQVENALTQWAKAVLGQLGPHLAMDMEEINSSN